MSDPNVDAMRDLAPGYALGALSPEESRAFEAALATNPDLQREVAEYREVNALLGESGGLAPSPELRARLRERIRGSEAALPARRSFAPLAAGMALAAMLLLSIGLTLKVRVLNDAVRTRDSLLTDREAQLADREATLNSILEPGVQLTTLVATGTSPVVQIFYDRIRGSLVVHTFRLPPAPTGRIYQLWLLPKRGTPIASETFDTEADGHRLLKAVSVPAGTDVAGFALTVEPLGGSPQPTTTPFLAGMLPAPQ